MGNTNFCIFNFNIFVYQMKLFILFLILILLFLPNPFWWNISLFDYIQNCVRKFLIMKKIVPMNTKTSKDNLFVFDDIMKKLEIEYWLSEGTALGAIREQGFIPGDDDVDTGMHYMYREKFIKEGLPLLKKAGFKLVFSWCHGNNFGFMRNNEKLDVDIVQPGGKCIACVTKHAMCKTCDEMIPHLNNMETIDFLGRSFTVPSEDYLVYLYGEDWRVPIKNKELVIMI